MSEELRKLQVLQELAAGHAFVVTGGIHRMCGYNANHEDARYCTQRVLERLITLEECIVAVRAVSHDIMRIVDDRYDDEADYDHR